MTLKQKQELISEVVALLCAKMEADAIQAQTPEQVNPSNIEMLTVKECVDTVKGLSEHAIRQLISQGKIPFIRTGQGKRGKILISKSSLLKYFGDAA